MTVQPVAIVDKGSTAFPNTIIATWTSLASGDTGAPISYPQFNDKSVHIKGTFGASGSCTLEGSHDGVTWVALTDPQGNAITKTSEAIETISENMLYIRPNVSGTGPTLTVIVVGVKGSR